jgi:hypothetical protein
VQNHCYITLLLQNSHSHSKTCLQVKPRRRSCLCYWPNIFPRYFLAKRHQYRNGRRFHRVHGTAALRVRWANVHPIANRQDISGFPFPTLITLLSGPSDIPHSWFYNCYIDLRREKIKWIRCLLGRTPDLCSEALKSVPARISNIVTEDYWCFIFLQKNVSMVARIRWGPFPSTFIIQYHLEHLLKGNFHKGDWVIKQK